MDDNQAVARGHRAFNELEEVQAAFDKVREVLINELIGSPVGQDGKILRLHMAIDALAAVRKVMRDTIDNGMVAQATRDAVAVHGLTRPV